MRVRTAVVLMVMVVSLWATTARTQVPAVPPSDTGAGNGTASQTTSDATAAEKNAAEKQAAADAAKALKAAADAQEGKGQKKAAPTAAAKEAALKAAQDEAEKAAADKTLAEKALADKAAAEKTARDRAAVQAARARAVEQEAEKKRVAAARAARKVAIDRALLIAATTGSLLAVALLLIPLVRRKPEPPAAAEPLEVLRRLDGLATRLDGGFQLIEDRLQKTSADLAATLAGANVLTPAHLTAVATELDGIRQDISRLGGTVVAAVTSPHRPAQITGTDPVSLERQVLDSSWKQFCANKDLSAAFDNAKDNAWTPLLAELTKLVPNDLKPTFDAVAAPWREHRTLVDKIGVVPKLVSGEIKRLDSEAGEVWRTRELATLLGRTLNAGETSNILNFPFKSWVTDTFLPFADLYLQRYQQAQLDNRHGELQPGATLVRKVLGIAAVEPIDVILGETPFDSSRHVGRSTTNDPRFADGVITGVVRNGFIEGGQQVIRQPEVIVNRMR